MAMSKTDLTKKKQITLIYHVLITYYIPLPSCFLPYTKLSLFWYLVTVISPTIPNDVYCVYKESHVTSTWLLNIFSPQYALPFFVSPLFVPNPLKTTCWKTKVTVEEFLSPIFFICPTLICASIQVILQSCYTYIQ